MCIYNIYIQTDTYTYTYLYVYIYYCCQYNYHGRTSFFCVCNQLSDNIIDSKVYSNACMYAIDLMDQFEPQARVYSSNVSIKYFIVRQFLSSSSFIISYRIGQPDRLWFLPQEQVIPSLQLTKTLKISCNNIYKF